MQLRESPDGGSERLDSLIHARPSLDIRNVELERLEVGARGDELRDWTPRLFPTRVDGDDKVPHTYRTACEGGRARRPSAREASSLRLAPTRVGLHSSAEPERAGMTGCGVRVPPARRDVPGAAHALERDGVPLALLAVGPLAVGPLDGVREDLQ